MTDAALVTAARSGDREAFAAQDALLIAMTSLTALRDDDAFGAWLCRIGRDLARRRTLDHPRGV